MISSLSFHAALDRTWPPAEFHVVGPWVFRKGNGGGKRVSAATANFMATVDDIPLAVHTMQKLGQQPLFMIQSKDSMLDSALDKQNYKIVDPVNVYIKRVSELTEVPIPHVTAFTIWEPLAIMVEIWAKGGIGSERLQVMHRAAVKTGILARWNQKPAGSAFVAIHNKIAMVHAVEVLPEQRRQGVAGWIMRRAAVWSKENCAEKMVVLCTQKNIAANTFYQGLGFRKLCSYHYRQSLENK
jgi:ribosomal protein S18 acetylase RimI-like enzyme